jgi:hypothetical protein
MAQHPSAGRRWRIEQRRRAGVERASTTSAPGAAARGSTKREISPEARVGREDLLRFPVRTQTTPLRSRFPSAVFGGQAQAEVMSLRARGLLGAEHHVTPAPTAGRHS